MHWPFVMKLISKYFLGHADNIHINYVIISRTFCRPFWLMLKTYFVELLINRWSDFHQNWIRWSSDCADKMLWISCWYTKWFSFSAPTNLLEGCQNVSEAVSLHRFDIFTPNFACAIVTTNWSRHINLVTAPPIGLE